MKPELQQQMIQRIHAHLAQRTTDTDPSGQPTLLPVAAYADAAPELFRRMPLAVGHVSQLPHPGDFFTHDASGLPLLVARGDDGRIRAFKNVCRLGIMIGQ